MESEEIFSEPLKLTSEENEADGEQKNYSEIVEQQEIELDGEENIDIEDNDNNEDEEEDENPEIDEVLEENETSTEGDEVIAPETERVLDEQNNTSPERDTEDNIEKTTTENNKEKSNETRLTHLPLSKIKKIIKLDPEMKLISNEALILVTKATELFIESLAKEAFSYTAQSKKKTLQRRDVEMAIDAVDALCFLEDCL